MITQHFFCKIDHRSSQGVCSQLNLTKLADAGIFAASAEVKEEPNEASEEKQTEPEKPPENGSTRRRKKEAL